MTTPNEPEQGFDPARELALIAALDFHNNADSDDPQTVITTAETFLGFLLAGTSRSGKHVLSLAGT